MLPAPKIFLALSFGAALACVTEVPAQKVHPEELKLKPKIDSAIHRGVKFLIANQQRNGTWGRYGNYDGGKTALIVYALLKSGVPYDHPAVRRGLVYMDSVPAPEQVYTVACMMLAYAATGQPRFHGRLKELARKLIRWQRGGDYGYPHHHGTNEGWSRPDLSNTQYAALGLWIADKHKIAIPGAVWRKLIAATLRYQSRPEQVKLKRKGKHTVTSGKSEIRGFGYTPRGKPSGSMTTAGVSVLQMCKIGLAEKMVQRRKVDTAIEQGLDWLGHHFAVNKNPFKKGWTYYYLYGLERAGSLTSKEKFGKHWWYLRGAKQILGWQDKDGGWRRGAGGHTEVKSAFALLFLRRATGLASVTGGGNAVSKNIKHVFSAGNAKNAVTIGGAGQQPLNLWISGFGEKIRKQHAPHGLRILEVEYLAGKRVLGKLAGDPRKTWQVADSFLYRANALQRGTHQIRARVKVVKADAAPGASEPVEILESPPMKVQIRDVFAEWMNAAASLSRENKVPGNIMRVVATSDSGKAKLAFDGRDDTHWVCGNKDKVPELSLTTKRGVPTRKLTITQAGNKLRDLGHFDRIKVIEVYINKTKDPIRIKLHPDQLAVTVFELPRTRVVRLLRVRVVERTRGRARGRAGFSEIGLSK